MLKKFLVCLGIAVIVTGCSSGGTNTSVGLNLTGSWSGVIRSSTTGQSATMTLSLTQAIDSSDVTGVATFGRGACMGGANVTGSVAGSGINLTVESSTSTLSLGGQFNAENSIAGSWFNEAKAVSTPTTTTTTTTRSTTELATACADESGTWSLGRR